MEEVHYGPDDEMDEDVEEEEDDAEMDYDNETGSEDTSHTDEEEDVDMEEEMENETGESEEGWHDEDEEEDLVENDIEHEGEDDDAEDEDEDDAGEEDVMWQVKNIQPFNSLVADCGGRRLLLQRMTEKTPQMTLMAMKPMVCYDVADRGVCLIRLFSDIPVAAGHVVEEGDMSDADEYVFA